MGTEDIVYKKYSKKHYIIGVILIAVVVGAGYFIFNFLTNKASSSVVPDGYKFSLVEENENTGEKITYYIYDNQIWTEDVRSQVDKTVMLYENINTGDLKLKDGDPSNCETGSCKAYTKVLKNIKKLLQNQVGRQQLSF